MTEGVLDVKDVTIFADLNASGILTALACATDAQLEVTKELREILCKDTGGGVDYKPSITRWSGSGTGFLAFDSPLGGVDLMDTMIAGTEVKIRFGTTASGDVYYEGDALISNVSFSSSGGAGDNVTYSVSFQGKGIPVKGIV